MKIMVVGSGGREHALAYALSKSPLCESLIVSPGNPGMPFCCVSGHSVEEWVEIAKDQQIDLTVVGPEAALAQGIVDVFEKEGLTIFGPSQAATQIESSKSFAKELMKEANIPTASYASFDNQEDALAYLASQQAPIVVKEDGLKAGKGVSVCQSMEEAIEAIEQAFTVENKVVIETCLQGFEYSLICLVHGTTVVPLEVAQDHKRAYDGDQGPNTGGMGAYSPVKAITSDLVEETLDRVIRPAAQAMVEKGCPFTGFLYGGLMLTDEGIQTIEFNARFGDPEAEVILPRLKSDLVQAILDVMNDRPVQLEWTSQACLGVVLASQGYPATSTKGVPMFLDLDELTFHMGTDEKDGQLVTGGGRVLMVCALSDDLAQARDLAYEKVAKIKCDALWYRHDIGMKELG